MGTQKTEHIYDASSLARLTSNTDGYSKAEHIYDASSLARLTSNTDGYSKSWTYLWCIKSSPVNRQYWWVLKKLNIFMMQNYLQQHPAGHTVRFTINGTIYEESGKSLEAIKA